MKRRTLRALWTFAALTAAPSAFAHDPAGQSDGSLTAATSRRELLAAAAQDPPSGSIPSDAGAAANDPPGPFELHNEDRPLGRKFWRAEFLTASVQAIGMGSLVLLPASVTSWTAEPWKHPGENLKRAWTSAPRWDNDPWYLNYVGHPYSGSLYYNALRSQGATRLQSFVYSVAQSTTFEYVFEAIAEQPSIQDLIATPLVGSLLGELSHRATLKMGQHGFNTAEKIIVFVIDPMFVVNNGYHPPRRARP